MRKLILDTETTGLSKNYNKIIEIGVVETVDNIPTGEFFHVYLNPMMVVSEESFNVCGLTNEFLNDKPLFKDIVRDLDVFLGNDPIVAHNASFDMGFLNMERESIGLAPLTNEVIDTLKIARKVFAGLPCSLDALCKRFKVSLHKRDKHGALLDAELLTKVYFYLLEKQSNENSLLEIESELVVVECYFQRPPLLVIDEEDKKKHLEFLFQLGFDS
jgi:DNA polymerase-3 subunit epsilon